MATTIATTTHPDADYESTDEFALLAREFVQAGVPRFQRRSTCLDPHAYPREMIDGCRRRRRRPLGLEIPAEHDGNEVQSIQQAAIMEELARGRCRPFSRRFSCRTR